MSEKINKLIEDIHKLEANLEAELQKTSFERGDKTPDADEETLSAHRLRRIGVFRYLVDANVHYILSAPLIYMLIIPFALLDLMVSIYQSVCFRIYKIPLVRRSDFMVFDRGRLAYLNKIEQINCAYCSYGNGVIAFVREVSARTERFWCPIKHASHLKGTHSYYRQFEEYGEGGNYQQRLVEQRQTLSALDEESPRDSKD